MGFQVPDTDFLSRQNKSIEEKKKFFVSTSLHRMCVCVCVPTYTCICDPPAEVLSGVVAVEEDHDDVAVGLNLSWRFITAERTELSAACFNLSHTHTHD